MKLEITDVASNIQSYAKRIGVLAGKLDELAEKRAKAKMEYEKAIAVEMLKLKSDHPVTMIDKLAKGKCADKGFEYDIAESSYKSQIVKIDAAKSILNANQSLFRHLEQV